MSGRRYNNDSGKFKQTRRRASVRQGAVNEIRYWILFDDMAQTLSPVITDELDALMMSELAEAPTAPHEGPDPSELFTCESVVNGDLYPDEPPDPSKDLAHLTPRIRHMR